MEWEVVVKRDRGHPRDSGRGRGRGGGGGEALTTQVKEEPSSSVPPLKEMVPKVPDFEFFVILMGNS